MNRKLSNNRLVGKFTPIETVINKLLGKLSGIIYKSRLPDAVEKFTVDLSTARDNKRLSDRGGGEGLFSYSIRYPSWYYLKVLVKGTGSYNIRFIMPGRRSLELSNTEILKGDEIYWEFTELEFTNTAQTGVINPVFIIEKRYFER